MKSVMKFAAWLAIVIVSVVGNVIVGVISAIPVYFLWNWLMPELFQLTEITFVQSIGICVLCGFLFRSSGTKKEG